jgi:hypothetical protein
MRTTTMRKAGIVAAALAVALPGAAIAKSGDRDNDGMPNSFETSNGLRVSQNDAARDADRDGLSNLREYRGRTKPRDADTDNDALNDGAERRAGTNPRDRDSDNDGVLDGAEAEAADDSRSGRDCPEREGESQTPPSTPPQS